MVKLNAVLAMKMLRILSYQLPRILLGGVFIYSGGVKLLDVRGFASLVSEYGLVPEALLAPVAFGLPVLEVLAGVGLLLEVPGALSAISAMLIMFCTVLWYGILKDLDIDCGCFSTAELRGHAGLRQALYRDFVMIALCGNLFLHRFFRLKRAGSGGWRKNLSLLI